MGYSEKLTSRQQAFVEHYAACGNATEAARLAGYKKPHPQGAENLLKPTIQAALSAFTSKVASARIATAQERQEFWTGVMRGVDVYKPHIKTVAEPTDQAPNQPPPEPEPEIEMKDRLKASELLGKAQRDFVVQIDTPDGGNIAAALTALLAGGTHVLGTLQIRADDDSDSD
ncbi:MAG: terminase small subunit [Candidatus Contendobacter sp.]|nr:terminase small subunit [Candidatus Contendobacter sp.]